MTGDECYFLVRVAYDINMIVLDKAYGLSSCRLVVRCCQLFAASHSACTSAVNDKIETRSRTEIANSIHQRAHRVLAALLTWLEKNLPLVLSYDGKKLQFSDEIRVST